MKGIEHRRGQAIVEFVIGLVVVLVLLSGLLQIASLAMTHTHTMVAARLQAAQLAMMDADVVSSPAHILGWEAGPDLKTYTRDDYTTTQIDPSGFNNVIVENAAENPAGWNLINLAPTNRISELRGNGTPVAQFGLVKGSDQQSVPLLPAFQHLIYASPSINVKCDVWMTHTKGLY